MSELDGKVAIVTGAGRGLGREEAIDLAAHGARVIVNDIDLPEARTAAEETVEDIRAAGGEALLVLGDCASTEDAGRAFKTALDTWGEMNIMVNNAGFLRDRTIFSMSDEEFDSVVRVHLRGHFVNMRNATNYWRSMAKAGTPVYGRLISTSSEAALYGSAGQPNYAAAKAGIVTMTMGAAQLMIKYGITCNVLMPRAATDMTMQGPTAAMFQAPEEGFHQFDAANVAPLVTYLCSPRAAHISGEVFIAWGNQVSVVKRPEPLKPHINPEGACKWTMDSLEASLSDYFDENHRPVLDGFALPIG